MIEAVAADVFGLSLPVVGSYATSIVTPIAGESDCDPPERTGSDAARNDGDGCRGAATYHLGPHPIADSLAATQ